MASIDTGIHVEIRANMKEMLTAAHIPWLEKPVRPGSSDDFSECMIAQVIHATTGDREKRKLFAFLTFAVPHFLPASYHQINCEKPSACPSDINMQWKQIFRFLFYCNNFEHTSLAELFNDIQSGNEDLKLALAEGINQHCFRDTPATQQCKSAAEFLLEPFVLIQLPFQPVLLHQWAVTLLAEALIFQKRIIPLFSFGNSTKIDYLELFRTMLLAMKSCANFLLTLYTKICLEGQENNSHSIVKAQFEEFSNHMIKVLPILEFVTHEDVTSSIRGTAEIKEYELKRGIDFHPSQVVISESDELPMPIYDFWFWTTKCDLKEVLTGALGDRGRNNTDLLSGFNTSEGADKIGSTKLEWLKKLVDETLLKSGRFYQVDREILMTIVENHAAELEIYFDRCLHYLATSSSTPKMKIGVYGVINNIICLHSDAKMTEVLELMTKHIYELLKITDATKDRFRNYYSAEKPTSEKSTLENRTDEYLAYRGWTWNKILSDIRETISSSLVKAGVSDIEEHPEKIAKYFQDRIRRLVYTMASRHFLTLGGENFEFYPEHQIVQYVLPCFVLHLLEIFKDTSVSLTVKQNCMRFVDNLIASYEQNEYKQVLSNEKKDPIQNQRDANGGSAIQMFALKDLLHSCICMNEKSTAWSIPNLLLDFQKAGDYELPYSHAPSPWAIQIDMFMKRVMRILTDMLPADDKKYRLITHTACSIDKVMNTLEDDTRAIFNLLKNSALEILDALPKKSLAAARKDANVDLRTVPKAMLKAAQNLSWQQLAGLFVFLSFKKLDALEYSQWKNQFQGPGFPLDSSSVLIWSVATGDRWKIKQLVSPMLMAGSRKGKHLRDPSFVPIHVLKSNRCFASVLEMISPDGTKVQMKQPGEITFVPVKHCRWCGLIAAEEFRLCRICVKCPEYLDINYFCSEKCETVALDTKHREDHVRYNMIQRQTGYDHYIFDFLIKK